jgi:NADH dehydrogenase
MGRLAVKNILRRIDGKETLAFRYRDYGMLATIGSNAAVGIVGRLRISGYPAWLMWLLAHIYFLINFRNRLIVMIDWAWAYSIFQK